jgi:hypothetical protein
VTTLLGLDLALAKHYAFVMLKRRLVLRLAVLSFFYFWCDRQATAQSPCSPQGDAALSETRAARWLMSDEANASATLDSERLWRSPKELQAPPKLSVLAFAGLSGQTFDLPLCTDRGSRTGDVRRLRSWAGIGLTHQPSGLHVRFSFLYGEDALRSEGDRRRPDDEDAPVSSAGYAQKMFVLRLGHERWFHGTLGFIEAESRFNEPDAGFKIVTPLKQDTSTPGMFVGAMIPALHLGFSTLVRSGKVEVLNVASRDVRLGRLPIEIGFNPMYIHEERRAIGSARVHVFSESEAQLRDADTDEATNGLHTRGATLEASVEARDARFRHGRFRYGHSFAGVREISGSHIAITGYLESTVFRSAFFARDIKPENGNTRGTAWGGGFGSNFLLHFPWFGLSFDGLLAFNRPELLQIIPSAQNCLELKGAIAVRLETQ